MVKIHFAELSTPSARSSAHLSYVFQFSQVFSFPMVDDNKALDNAKQVSANRGNTAKLSLLKMMKGLDISQSREKADDFGCTRPQNLTRDLGNSTDSSDDGHCLHRRRTLYLIRHGEAEHNVLEAIAQKKAKEEAQKLNLSSEETLKRMEEARKSVLNDVSLSDAPLTEKGRQQAKEASRKLKEMIAINKIHHPTEAMCSPLSRCLETCKILLDDSDLKAHIRPEISERRTLYPPDKPKPLDDLLRYTREDGRFLIGRDENVYPEHESKEMLRARANDMFHLLMECEHRHILIVSHKGFLRELERGLLKMPESPLFDNCEMRVYRVIFTVGDRKLYHQERIV